MESGVVTSKSNKVIRILNHLYDQTETLKEFAKRIVPAEVLQFESDDGSYVSLLRSTLVCFPPGARSLPQSWNTQQHSQQNELVLRIIERIRHREGIKSTNVLTVGYYSKSEKSAAQISSSSYRTEYGFSNNNAGRLLYTEWKMLLARIGDDAMEYLLENLVIFVFASCSCYIQINGTPLYELWPFRRYCAPSYQRLSVAKRLRNSVLNDSKNKRFIYSRAKKKSRKKNKVRQDNVLVAGLVANKMDTCQTLNDCQPLEIARDATTGKQNLDTTIEAEIEAKRLCIGDSCNEYFPTLCRESKKVVNSLTLPTSISSDKLCSNILETSNSTAIMIDPSSPTASMSVVGANCLERSSQLHFGSPDEDGSLASSCYLSTCGSPNQSCTFLSATSTMNCQEMLPVTMLNTGRPMASCDSGQMDIVDGVTVQPSQEKLDTALCFEDLHFSFITTASQTEQAKQVIKTRKKRQRVRKGKLSAGQSANDNNIIKKSMPFLNALCIERTGLLYSKNLSEPLQPRYIMSGDASTLANQILTMRVDGSSFPPQNTAPSRLLSSDVCDAVRSRLVSLARSFTTSHYACPYKRLLNFHCKHPHSRAVESSDTFGSYSTVSDSKIKETTEDLDRNMPADRKCSKRKINKQLRRQSDLNHLLQEHCSYRNVYLFVRACCLRVIPTTLFGSKSNRNVFFRNVRKFIGLGRYEQLSLGVLMTGMKVTHCRWMAELHSNDLRLALMAKVVYWLMSAYVLKLLRSYFYVTDTAVYKNRMFYYRKSVWKIIHCKGLAMHTRKRIFERITADEAAKSVHSGESLGFASLRFLPKLRGLRSIVNMSHRRKAVPNKVPINYQLRDLHQIFTSKRALFCGSSVFSLDDIWTRWKQFINSRRLRNDERPLYFVKVDIEDCYDSIDQCRMFEIASRLLCESDGYAVRRFVTVVAAGGRLKRSFHRDATPLADFQPSFMLFVRKKITERQSNNTIFVDRVWHNRVNTTTLLSRLRAHLFHNIVSVDRRYFRQVRGIAQGSVLSTLLCDVYYGDMEANRITVTDQELLMRQVDDFLFVTPDHASAVTFLDLLSYGVDDYNCRINKHKTLVNFPVEDIPGEVGIQQLPDNAMFPWCGLLIDTATLAVHTDFTRYAGLHISDTITVDVTRNAGRAMLDKLLFSLRSRCHRIYLDSDINPRRAITVNIYRIFLLAAFKFHRHVKRLPVRNNPAFLVYAIYEICNFVESYVKKSGVEHPLGKNVIQLLCVEAFNRKFQRHQGGYKFVLKAMRKRLKKLRRLVGGQSLNEINATIENALPAEFECMIT